MTQQALTERDLFRSYWDDGTLDLLCGLALLVSGLGWESGIGALAVIQAPLWIVLWTPLRQRIVEPRAGYVRFSKKRRQRSTHQLGLSVMLGAGILVLVAAGALLVHKHGAGPAIGLLIPGLPALLVAVAAVIASLLTGARRFLVYALVLLAAAAATITLSRGPALPLVLAGLVVVAAAIFLLRRFFLASQAYQAGQ